MNQNKKNQQDTDSSGLAIGMCLGLSIGCAIGVATQNIGLWLPVGLGLGVCFGLAFGRKQADGVHEETKEQEAETEDNN